MLLVLGIGLSKYGREAILGQGCSLSSSLKNNLSHFEVLGFLFIVQSITLNLIEEVLLTGLRYTMDLRCLSWCSASTVIRGSNCIEHVGLRWYGSSGESLYSRSCRFRDHSTWDSWSVTNRCLRKRCFHRRIGLALKYDFIYKLTQNLNLLHYSIRYSYFNLTFNPTD